MIADTEAKSKEKRQKSGDALSAELLTLRCGRANPHILDKISVDYYGTPTPLSQIAAVAAPEARLITIQPWDVSAMKAIEKAILASDLGLNPSNDGKVIRLLIPALTEERRKQLAKGVGKSGEECKVALRNIRSSAIEEMKKAEKAKEVTEDDVKDGEKNLQKTVDEFSKKIDELVKEKEKEIMTV
jgi:ribosome recycling factor